MDERGEDHGTGPMREVVVTFADLATKHEAHEAIARRMGFPSYYGCNLSALRDCLGDVDRPTRLVLDLADVDDLELASYLRHLASVAMQASADNPSLEVLVRGL
jgi:RNAse (barnase) inhibitor barstar